MNINVDITQGSYWGGAQIPYWVLMIFTVFFGCGLDHLLLRSPLTAIAKCISIVPLFGFWYFFDIAQVFGERELVEKYGLAVPFYGPMGIGAGIFTGDKKPLSPLSTPRPWGFMAYVITTMLFIITPINKLVIGDYWGAIAHFLLYFVGIGIFWGLWDAYNIVFKTKDVFENGTPRMPPASWVIGRNFNRGALGPVPSSDTSWVSSIISLTKAVPKIVESVANEGPRVVHSVGKALEKELPPIIHELASAQKIVPPIPRMLQGGGILMSNEPSLSSTVILFSIALLAFGGYVTYTMRNTFKTKVDEDDDRPPSGTPHTVI